MEVLIVTPRSQLRSHQLPRAMSGFGKGVVDLSLLYVAARRIAEFAKRWIAGRQSSLY